MSDEITEVLPQIEKAARAVASKWPGVVEEGDMVNDLILHFLERAGSLETLATLPVEKRVARLTAIGHEKASAEMSAHEVFTGQVTYSVEDVKKLLGAGALEGQMDRFEAAVEDVGRAAAELRESNDRYHGLLWQRFVLGQFPKGADKEALSQAIVSLTVKMNRVRKANDYEFENGGRFRNNNQAIAATGLDYEGSW
jgi:hypothetical protein